jgi:hypothetical protein
MMISQDKINEIRKQLKRGEPEGEIKEKLKLEGFTNEDIAAVFEPHHYDMRSWYLFFGIIVLLAGLYLFIKTSGILTLALAALLFVAYFYEIKRLESRKKIK